MCGTRNYWLNTFSYLKVILRHKLRSLIELKYKTWRTAILFLIFLFFSAFYLRNIHKLNSLTKFLGCWDLLHKKIFIDIIGRIQGTFYFYDLIEQILRAREIVILVRGWQQWKYEMMRQKRDLGFQSIRNCKKDYQIDCSEKRTAENRDLWSSSW